MREVRRTDGLRLNGFDVFELDLDWGTDQAARRLRLRTLKNFHKRGARRNHGSDGLSGSYAVVPAVPCLTPPSPERSGGAYPGAALLLCAMRNSGHCARSSAPIA